MELGPDLVQHFSSKFAPLANKLLCTECESVEQLSTMHQNGFEAIPFEGLQYLIWK